MKRTETILVQRASSCHWHEATTHVLSHAIQLTAPACSRAVRGRSSAPSSRVEPSRFPGTRRTCSACWTSALRLPHGAIGYSADDVESRPARAVITRQRPAAARSPAPRCRRTSRVLRTPSAWRPRIGEVHQHRTLCRREYHTRWGARRTSGEEAQREGARQARVCAMSSCDHGLRRLGHHPGCGGLRGRRSPTFPAS